MFFFVFTSQSVGSPLAFDTMLRSGVPPHIGQSPVPGSEATRRVAAAAAIRHTAATLRTRAFLMLFIGRKFQIVDVSAELSIYEEPWRSVAIADRIRLVDLPRRRLRLARRPRLAARAHLT